MTLSETKKKVEEAFQAHLFDAVSPATMTSILMQLSKAGIQGQISGSKILFYHEGQQYSASAATSGKILLG